MTFYSTADSSVNTYKDSRVLVMTSVDAERDAVLRGLHGERRFDVKLAGVGQAAAAANTAAALATAKYDLVVNAGIAGGFACQAEIGSLVIANDIVAADLGAESAEGFLSLDELGFGSSRAPVDLKLAEQAAKALKEAGLPVTTGPILTVSTVTGSDKTAQELAARVPGAAAEAMEGYGVAIAARHYNLPILEIRAISNQVGPRNKDAWRIKEALNMLEKASNVLLEVLK
ncbi:futalosine hydrolase [Fictibacillus gelatini]|uniref:futalosine hydrolase n=1 Tax=Fictibacillus gelatini TaxID=225985 RepID=UPI00041C2FEB|nr:futalosine hydrolase [Fictibacillus gelatini]